MVTESEWLKSADLSKLLYLAKELNYTDRKIRLFSVACIRRILCVYNMEVACLVETAERVFDDGQNTIQELRAMIEIDAIARYRAPFQLGRTNPITSAIGVMEGILEDTGWEDHGCLSVFREVFGNPFKNYSVQATSLIVQMAKHVYAGASAGPLADALEDSEQREEAAHLRENNWHPKGCWVLDKILNKR